MAIVIPITGEYLTGTWQYYFNWDNSIYGALGLDQLKIACWADVEHDVQLIVTDSIGDQIVNIPAPYHGSFTANIRLPARSTPMLITPTFDTDDVEDSIKSIQLILIADHPINGNHI